MQKSSCIVKLTPNVTSITDIAKAVESAGADAVSLINTVLAMAVDAERQRPVLSTITGGLSLQTAESWAQFIDRECGELGWCGKVSEIYFEEDDFDAFAEKLSDLDIHYVHPVKEHAWGQRVVRFFDPDGHIIEVGENVKTVCRRFLDSEMSPEQVAERMDVPLKFVKGCMR